MTLSVANKHKESQELRALTFDIAYGDDGTVKELFLLPKGARIVDIIVDVEAAFNDSGTDLLEVGTKGNPDAILDDVDLSFAGRLIPGGIRERVGAAADVADGGTIAHGMSVTPDAAFVTPSVASEMASVTGIDAADITVALKADDGSAGTSQTVYWRAVALGSPLADAQYEATAMNGVVIVARYNGENSDASAGAAKLTIVFAYDQGTRM